VRWSRGALTGPRFASGGYLFFWPIRASSAVPSLGVVGIMGGVVLRGVHTSNHPALVRRTGDHAMTSITTKPDGLAAAAEATVDLFDNWFDPMRPGCASGFASSSMP